MMSVTPVYQVIPQRVEPRGLWSVECKLCLELFERYTQAGAVQALLDHSNEVHLEETMAGHA